LNSCNSYHQGLALVETGAIGGIVTLNEVINDGAVRIGETVARLLNAGFPLRAALNIAREQSVLGGQYIVVGDGGMTVTQPASVVPYSLELVSENHKFEVTIKTYATDYATLGTVFMPFIPEVDKHFLSSGEIGTFQLSESDLRRFLALENVPVKINGDLRWSSSLCLDEIS